MTARSNWRSFLGNRLSGPRSRLAAVLAVALAPLVMFQVYALQGDRADNIALAHERAADFVAAGVERFRDATDDARTILDLVASMHDLAPQGEACNQLLSKVQATRRWARAMWVVGEDGKAACSTVPEGVGIDVSDREWYQQALARNDFILSDFYFGKLRNLPASIAALPVTDKTTGHRKVFAVTLDLRWFDEVAASLGRRIKGSVALIDSKGNMLSTYPRRDELIGQNLANSDAGSKSLQTNAGTFEGKSLNGIPRLYATHILDGTQARLVVGFDRDSIMAPVNAETRQAIIFFVLVGLIVSCAIWLAGTRVFVRPLNRLDELLRTTLETMDQGLIVVDAHGRIPFCNRRARELLELPAEVMNNYPHTDDVYDYQVMQGEFTDVPEELHPKLRPIAHRHASDIYERERPNGQILQVQTVPLGDGGVVRTFTDITARKREERALEEAMMLAERTRRDAENASAAKSEFLASMSHEIRTPLNGIMGFAEVLADQTELTEQQQHYVDMIRGAGSALLTVVNDVLEFSRIEAGAIILESRAFPLGVLVEEAMAIVAHDARLKELALSCNYDRELPAWVSGDENRLRQILLNLLNNAVKFTRAGSVKLTVAKAGGDNRVRFTIEDTGIGIPEAKHDRLFRRFSQVDTSIGREFGGSGLGLAICERLITAMHGEIGFTSQELKGSTFWFAVDLPPAQPIVAAASIATPGRRGQPARILVVDDLASNLEIVSSMLRAAGYQVETAKDGEAAIAAVIQSEFGLVLMDVQMPGLDGMAATRRIRRMEGSVADIPIVAMTAYAFAEQVEQFSAAGMNGHVGKPFRKKELLDIVEHYAGGAATKRPPPPTQQHDEMLFDQTAFDGVAELMPASSVARLLVTFQREIETPFDQKAAADRTELAKRTHRTAASAGFLGFATLSRLCKEIETICHQPGAPKLPLKQTEEQRLMALKKLETLMASYEEAAPEQAAE